MTTALTGRGRGGLWKAAAFLFPALILLGAMLVYPIIFTVIRSTFDATGRNQLKIQQRLQQLKLTS